MNGRGRRLACRRVARVARGVGRRGLRTSGRHPDRQSSATRGAPRNPPRPGPRPGKPGPRGAHISPSASVTVGTFVPSEIRSRHHERHPLEPPSRAGADLRLWWLCGLGQLRWTGPHQGRGRGRGRGRAVPTATRHEGRGTRSGGCSRRTSPRARPRLDLPCASSPRARPKKPSHWARLASRASPISPRAWPGPSARSIPWRCWPRST